MKTTIGTGIMLLLAGLLGCSQTAPMSETYTVETKQNELVAGKKCQIEVVVKYQRNRQPAAKLNYQVQFSAPADLTLTPASWDVAQNLTTNDAGFNYAGLLTIDVTPNAEPGDRDITVTITPAQGAISTALLKLHVARKPD